VRGASEEHYGQDSVAHEEWGGDGQGRAGAVRNGREDEGTILHDDHHDVVRGRWAADRRQRHGTVSYLASDGLGSVSAALSTGGSLTAAQLFAPYGGLRYSTGTMPTARGFTGQYGDAVSGLDYDHARYYDPVIGQFASADTKEGPNRFAYVAGNPETLTDPTGHRICATCDGGGGGDHGISYPQWKNLVRHTGIRGTAYISSNIERGYGAQSTSPHVLDAAADVAKAQNEIGGLGGKETWGYNLPTFGEGVVEFWYRNNGGQWELVAWPTTNLWESDGDANHAEWEAIRGNGGNTNGTVLELTRFDGHL